MTLTQKNYGNLYLGRFCSVFPPYINSIGKNSPEKITANIAVMFLLSTAPVIGTFLILFDAITCFLTETVTDGVWSKFFYQWVWYLKSFDFRDNFLVELILYFITGFLRDIYFGWGEFRLNKIQPLVYNLGPWKWLKINIPDCIWVCL